MEIGMASEGVATYCPALHRIDALVGRLEQALSVVPSLAQSYLPTEHSAGNGLLPGLQLNGDDTATEDVQPSHGEDDSLFIPEDEDGEDGEDEIGGEGYDPDASEHEDEEEDDSYNQAGESMPASVSKYLNRLARYISKLHRPSKGKKPMQCPHLRIDPKEHQVDAVRKIEFVSQGPLQGMVLADPPGLGKTLPAMMSIMRAKATAHRFSIVIAPASCIDQWCSEFERFFDHGALKVLAVRDATISPVTMLKQDAIVLSYGFVMSQYRKMLRYQAKIKHFYETGLGSRPVRPDISIFSEIFCSDNVRKGPYLILDEVNAIKNERSLTFKAVHALSGLCQTCIMLTGSPIDNTWPDIFAFWMFVKGHNFTTRRQMTNLLATVDPDRPSRLKPPSGKRYLAYLQILNSFMVRRPESVIQLPTLHERIDHFHLTDNESNMADEAFQTYKIAIKIAKKEKPSSGSTESPPFKSLTSALQHGSHGKLVDLMEFIRSTEKDKKMKRDGTFEDEDVLYNADQIAEWAAWKQMLKVDEAWRSSRISAVVDAVNRQRDLDPDCSIVIFDESVYFLDIVQIALENMDDPLECLRYDGRIVPEKRGDVLFAHEKAAGRKVLLMSRGAGGVGLNIQWGNMVILCAPWWKKQWEIQAYKRVWRTGQKREVTVTTLLAVNSLAEAYKAKIRDRKHKFNQRVVDHITRDSTEEVEVWDNFV